MSNNGDRGKFMRLYNIYYICKQVQESLNVTEIQERTKGGNTTYILTEWEEIKEALEILYGIDCLRDTAQEAYFSIPVITRSNLKPEISSSELNILRQKMNLLKQKVDAIVELYESMGLQDTNVGLEVKIPQIDNLCEYISILKDLDFVFTQCPYCLKDDEQLKFAGTDIGSTWLNFALISQGTFWILNNVAKLLNKAIALKSNLVTVKMQEEALEAMKQKNKVGQETIEVFETMKKLTYKQYMDELSEEISPTKDGDEEGRVEKSLEKLAGLLDKGVQIYTAIETPKDVKVLFPLDDKQEALPESLMKYLEDKAAKPKE